jgi:hypothetical protein
MLLTSGLLWEAGLARAEVPAVRSSGRKSTGARRDISVPYLTTGRSAFMSGKVAPRIFASPIVDDPLNPQARPVYNLPFYGGVQAFGGASNGAVPRANYPTRMRPGRLTLPYGFVPPVP